MEVQQALLDGIPGCPGWCSARDAASGDTFYVHTPTRRTSWISPARQSDLGICALPPGWEVDVDAMGHVYYVNHVARTTQRGPPGGLVFSPNGHDRRDSLLRRRGSAPCDDMAVMTVFASCAKALSFSEPGSAEIDDEHHMGLDDDCDNDCDDDVDCDSFGEEEEDAVNVVDVVEDWEAAVTGGALDIRWPLSADNDSDAREALPRGWQSSPPGRDGRRYFVDSVTRRVTWADPRTFPELLTLPLHIEIDEDEFGPFYVNHRTLATSRVLVPEFCNDGDHHIIVMEPSVADVESDWDGDRAPERCIDSQPRRPSLTNKVINVALSPLRLAAYVAKSSCEKCTDVANSPRRWVTKMLNKLPSFVGRKSSPNQQRTPVYHRVSGRGYESTLARRTLEYECV